MLMLLAIRSLKIILRFFWPRSNVSCGRGCVISLINDEDNLEIKAGKRK